jgi:hypothetical protein
MQFDLSPTFEPKEKERWKLTPLWSVERKQFLIVGKKNKAAEKTSHGKEEGGASTLGERNTLELQAFFPLDHKLSRTLS